MLRRVPGVACSAEYAEDGGCTDAKVMGKKRGVTSGKEENEAEQRCKWAAEKYVWRNRGGCDIREHTASVI